MLIIPYIMILSCNDENINCEYWKSKNQCNENPSYMSKYCKKTCDKCNFSCDFDAEEQFEKKFISSKMKYIEETYTNVTFLSREPWVLKFDNFLTDEESKHLISLCEKRFERSLAGDGVSQARTSLQCWCQSYMCVNDQILKNVEERIGNILGYDRKHAEYMQILKYEPGEYYKMHHDQNSNHKGPQGARIFTFFMYLNNVEEGGETLFNKLNITVKPKKNSAILWNSIKDEMFGVDETETYHEALPVIKGRKYAANLWFHSGKFRELSEHGCQISHISTYNPENTHKIHEKLKDEV